MEPSKDNTSGSWTDDGSIPCERSLTTIALKALPSLTGPELFAAQEILPPHLKIRVIQRLYGECSKDSPSKWAFKSDPDVWALLVSAYAQSTPKPMWFRGLCMRNHKCEEGQGPVPDGYGTSSIRPFKNVCRFLGIHEDRLLGGFQQLKWLQTPGFDFTVYLDLQCSALFYRDFYELSKIKHLQSLKLAKTTILNNTGTDSLSHVEPLRDHHIRNLMRYADESGGFSKLTFLFFHKQPFLTFAILDYCKSLPALQTLVTRDCRAIYPTKDFNLSAPQSHPHFAVQGWWRSEATMLKKLYKAYDERLKAQGDKSERQKCVLELQLTHSPDIAASGVIEDRRRRDREEPVAGSELILLWWKKEAFTEPKPSATEDTVLQPVTENSTNIQKQGQVRAHLKRKAKDAGVAELENYTNPAPRPQTPPQTKPQALPSPPKPKAKPKLAPVPLDPEKSPPWILEDEQDDDLESVV